MTDYETEQKPLVVNYISLDNGGKVTTVVDGKVVFVNDGSFQRALEELAATRRPYMHEGEPYELISMETFIDGVRVEPIEPTACATAGCKSLATPPHPRCFPCTFGWANI